MADLIDLRSFGDGFRTDPHPVCARLRERGPVRRVRPPVPDGYHETWPVVGYEVARTALADPRPANDAGRRGLAPTSRHKPRCVQCRSSRTTDTAAPATRLLTFT
ncbi:MULTISPECIES: hypothetical protein [unclassified Streptomyces]|uniref:hypothetical protein n=1 Tax=unclassified Streptomyces TaxID=2593676 RepID=UPI002B1E19F2|nr:MULTISPECIES: hypothetical protein [unclassified Streptomyces]